MHYYQFNIGDYRKDTGHLSLLEHGAYRQLLDWYYLSEEPIPVETESVLRRLCARTEEEKNAVLYILKEFFFIENGYQNKRANSEISSYKAKANRARENGKLGGRRAKTKEVLSGNQEGTKKEPIEKLTNELINPLTNKLKEKNIKKENPVANAPKKKSTLPEDFVPDETAKKIASEKNIVIDFEVENFKDWHKAKGSLFIDWQAALRTWLRRASSPREPPAIKKQSSHSGFEKINYGENELL